MGELSWAERLRQSEWILGVSLQITFAMTGSQPGFILFLLFRQVSRVAIAALGKGTMAFTLASQYGFVNGVND